MVGPDQFMVSETAAMESPEARSLDIFGQQPSLNLYTQICLCFSISDPSVRPTIVTRLNHGLQRLSASFPWLSGDLIHEGSGEDDSGVFKIQSTGNHLQLKFKELGYDSIINMETLRQARFPFSLLDENVIAPRKTVPGGPGGPAPYPAPVFMVQATFIEGGMLLTLNGHHQTRDMTGQGQVIYLFSKACGREPFTDEELSSGNLAGADLVPLLDHSGQLEASSKLDRQIAKPALSQSTTNNSTTYLPPPPSCTWAYFIFSGNALAELKAIAAAEKAPSVSFISTDDALSAFVWQSIIRIRLHRLKPAAATTLARAVDVRGHLGIPKAYPGLIQNMTFHKSTVKDLAEDKLGTVTSRLRAAVDPETSSLAHDTRALATVLHHSRDKSSVSFVADIDPSTDIMLSSWAKLNCYDLDFNIGLGKPEAVRRPQFVPYECLIYLMPKKPNGEIAVGLCLRDGDMKLLRDDRTFNKFCNYAG